MENNNKKHQDGNRNRNWSLSVPRFLIPNSRFVIGICSLLVTITFPLHATTPGFDTLVSYDTAWTFVYDAGEDTAGTVIYDDFYDVKCLADGNCVCVGMSADSTSHYGILLMKLDNSGKVLWKKLLNGNTRDHYNGFSICIANNGDFIIGGKRFTAPWIIRTDTAGNMKWNTWL